MHDFSLVVTDDEGAISEADELTITVESPNAAPIANAGRLRINCAAADTMNPNSAVEDWYRPILGGIFASRL